MSRMEVITVADSQSAAAIHALVVGFVADPAARRCRPSRSHYLAAMPRFIRAYGGAAFATHSAYVVGHGLGAALWLQPGVGADEAALVGETVAPDKQEDLVTSVEELGGYHPEEAH